MLPTYRSIPLWAPLAIGKNSLFLQALLPVDLLTLLMKSHLQKQDRSTSTPKAWQTEVYFTQCPLPQASLPTSFTTSQRSHFCPSSSAVCFSSESSNSEELLTSTGTASSTELSPLLVPSPLQVDILTLTYMMIPPWWHSRWLKPSLLITPTEHSVWAGQEADIMRPVCLSNPPPCLIVRYSKAGLPASVGLFLGSPPALG